ncbi:MAG: hypothetical protein IKZ90_06440 [Clostridiales bacterium]|nr:hypothetical protein [Clostridiales bacterium]
MRTVIINTYRNMFKSIKRNLTIFLNMVICTLAIFILLQNFYFLKDRHDEYFKSGKVASNYNIWFEDMDDYGIYTSDCFNKTSMYYVGQEVLKELESDPGVILYSASSFECPLGDFIDGPDLSPYANVDDIFGDLKIEQLYISLHAQDAFQLKCASGRLLEEKDYGIDRTEPVPAILGYNYQEVYKVGDIIHMKNDHYDDKAIVVGFLEKYSSLNLWNHIISLDTVMVMAGSFPRESEENEFYEKSSANEFRSVYEPSIYVKDEKLDLQKLMNSITAKNGFYTLSVDPTDGVEITETKGISEKNVMLIAIMTAVTGIICLITLGMVLYNRALEDLSTNCIYLLCGVPLWKINASIILEMLIWAALSCVPAIVISQLEYKEFLVSPILLFAFAAIVSFIALIPTLRVLKKVNLDMFVRDRIIV